MLFYFRQLFSRHATRLVSKASYVGACTAVTAGSLYYTHRMPDSEEKEIVMSHFFDPDACGQALYRHRKSKLRE